MSYVNPAEDSLLSAVESATPDTLGTEISPEPLLTTMVTVEPLSALPVGL